jgi:hypothetical protein
MQQRSHLAMVGQDRPSRREVHPGQELLPWPTCPKFVAKTVPGKTAGHGLVPPYNQVLAPQYVGQFAVVR